MIDTVVIATDGSESAARAVEMALDLAGQFESAVHALYVVDERELAGSPERLREELAAALEDDAEDALATVGEQADASVTTAVQKGAPVQEICDYAEAVDADVVALGTRGRHGDHAFVLGSVAEAVVRQCSRPVLTVRQLEASG
jgi:nucleotide-binding universal stress UspA family protein